MNPLLALLRTQPMLCPKCTRAYTFIRKDGFHKVKFYNIRDTTYNPQRICRWLESKGWRYPRVSVISLPQRNLVSLLIEATK